MVKTHGQEDRGPNQQRQLTQRHTRDYTGPAGTRGQEDRGPNQQQQLTSGHKQDYTSPAGTRRQEDRVKNYPVLRCHYSPLTIFSIKINFKINFAPKHNNQNIGVARFFDWRRGATTNHMQ